MATFFFIFLVIYVAAHDFCARKRVMCRQHGVRKACGCGCCAKVGKGGRRTAADSAKKRATMIPPPHAPHHGGSTSSDDEEELPAEGGKGAGALQRPHTPWVKLQDAQGRSLYYNETTNRSVWKLPPGAMWSRGGAAHYSVVNYGATKVAPQNPIQAGEAAATMGGGGGGIEMATFSGTGAGGGAFGAGVWEQRSDAQGRPFYFNTATNTSTWEEPPEMRGSWREDGNPGAPALKNSRLGDIGGNGYGDEAARPVVDTI
jgi:hypothetical protein